MIVRPYIVTNTSTGVKYIRVAGSSAVALRNVAANEYEVHAAGALEVANLMKTGIPMITVGEEQHVITE